MPTPRTPTSRARRRLAWLALPGLLILAACGPTSISEEQFQGLPENVTFTQAPDAPYVRWEEKPTTISVVTWGSSSCPAIATDMQQGADNAVTIIFETGSGEKCTADIAPTTHVILLPDDAQHAPVTIKTSIDGVVNDAVYVLD